MEAPRDEAESAGPALTPDPDRPAPSTGTASPPSPGPLPGPSLPKGGGAIRGIGEKFAANPSTGTGSFTLPLTTSPGRGGFGPSLELGYDSGAGNGPFGFGWSLELPRISRKTDKGLPSYRDAAESDDFILSGAEDLVRVLDAGGKPLEDRATAAGYSIYRYRPRVEGPFARIERWRRDADGDTHWRSISRDNVLSIYGKDAESRIADPVAPHRVFTWLISETRDVKGNAVVYDYKREDGVGADLRQVHQRNRGPAGDARRTANRYLKRIRYGNRAPLLDPNGRRPRDLTPAEIANARWMFEVVLDYGEHDPDTPLPGDPGPWHHRADAFSTYRAGFEVRTARRCERLLMFHHFPGETGVGNDCLVRAYDFEYTDEENPLDATGPVYTFLERVTVTGYKRANAGYEKRSLPPLEYEYTIPVIQDVLHQVDARVLEHLPAGIDGSEYQWIDLHGEGIPGVLTEQGDAWFYQRNISPISRRPVEFAPAESVELRPNAPLAEGRLQFMDLAGDGDLDAVVWDGPRSGFYEHEGDEGWGPFRPFPSWVNRDLRDPHLRLIDLDGDGRADILLGESDAFVWHRSLGEEGYGSAVTLPMTRDEERGPRLVFADGTQSVYLADLSGDGSTDLVRIRNGEVCYWPNLGHGAFGAKITMDGSPLFDAPDQFDQQRIRLADIDGSGTSDLIYLHRDGVRLYFNQAGNGWSAPKQLKALTRVEQTAGIVAADLFGNGTACLVWSSPLPGDTGRALQYVDLMGGTKPHLLVKAINNLGVETRVEYTSSTTFYLRDKYAGRPWISRLPFPVHVVERIETSDAISRNRFVTRYQYHHGHFDGEEREFRGFGMVEQHDTEELAALTGGGTLPPASNIAPASHIPPVVIRTWFHTGMHRGRDHVSDYFAGLLDASDRGEYYREPGLSDAQAAALLLPDTVLPPGLSDNEEREACRALKGRVLRRETYARDGSPQADHPYSVIEQNFGVRLLQPQGKNRHAVFYVHPFETLSYHYERNPADPRVQHSITLEVGPFGDVLKECTIGYGRRQPDAALPLQSDRDTQTRTLVTYTEHRVTNAFGDPALFPFDHRAPLDCESTTFELTGYPRTGIGGRFRPADLVQPGGGGLVHIFDTEIPFEARPGIARERRLIELGRTLYRPDDLGTAQNDPAHLLTLGSVERLALKGENYKLAFTPGLLASAFQQNGQPLVPNPAAVLGSAGADGGGYLSSQQLKGDGRFPNSDRDNYWWVPSGRTFLSPKPADTAAQELAHARAHFFLPQRFRDPFHGNPAATESVLTYDAHDCLVVESRDCLGNKVTAGERLPNGTIDPAKPGNDYRVLAPWRVMDPNRNRTELAFDALGMVVGTALRGKPEENLGDSLTGFVADLPEPEVLAHSANPFANPQAILGGATTRMVYDLFAYFRTRADPAPQPAAVYTIARETHEADLAPGAASSLQHAFSYSDGFGREIQKKGQAEPEDVNGVPGPPRWVGSGWTIFNNKGKPVRQFEPFFSPTHRFEFGVAAGVSPVLFYDPLERVVAALQSNRTYQKVVFDAWHNASWDENDTVAGDPRIDPDIKGYVAGYFAALPASPPAPPWQTWLVERQGGGLGPDEQAAAAKTGGHAGTPTTVHLDSLGRVFLTDAPNKVVCPNHPLDGTAPHFYSRREIDIEGNEREVRDADQQGGDPKGRLIMRYVYDLLGNRIGQLSMESGGRWTLPDVKGNPIRAWNTMGHRFRTEYDPLRRAIRSFVAGTDPANPNSELLAERIVHGEQHPAAEANNLRGRIHLHFDQAGVLTNEAWDFKGNLAAGARRLTGGAQYRQAVDWAAVDADHVALPTDAVTPLDPVALAAALAPRLEADGYVSATERDALSRPTVITAPHLPADPPSVVRLRYNEAGLIEAVDARIRGATAAGQPLWTPFILDLDYNARGQRVGVAFGNGVSTAYDYDPLTFRLTRLITRRGAAAFPGDCPAPPPAGWPGCQVQHLRYIYDPIGNVVQIRDEAQQAVFFRGKRVEPSSAYTYDAIYRLIDATGREHLGQVGGTPRPHSHDDAPRVGIDWAANDGNAMGTYIERYVYDAVGNFLEMQHRGSDPAHPGWSRGYTYSETSLLEDGTGGTTLKSSNRLSSTVVAANNPPQERYVYDAHGNIVRLPHFAGVHPAPNMAWDYRDRLQRIDRAGGSVYYVYDSAGQRIRKVWEKPANLVEERLYLGGLEIFRRRQGATRLERETLVLMDDKRRIALVETRTIDTAGVDPSPPRLIRYQHGNLLDSACLELDGQGQIITYEEYSPFGSTTYQAVRSQTETPKRYRFTGKERDEESGLDYHSARYCAPWLGRWVSPDPAGLGDGPNLYRYVRNNPIRLSDPSGTEEEDNLNFTATGQMCRVKMAPHVDEVEAVRGNLAGGVAGSPSDPANKRFADPRTNTQSKSNFVTSEPDNPRAPVSISKSPQDAANRIITGRFSEVDELKAIADEATKKTPAGQRTNAALRAAMKKDPAIRGALASIGINPDTLEAENPSGVKQFPKTGTVKLSPMDADVDPATGNVVPGPNTKAAMDRRAAKTSPPPSPAPAPKTGGGGTSGGGGGGGGGVGLLKSAGGAAGGVVRAAVPGVVEAEAVLVGGAYYAAGSTMTAPLVTPLLTAAEAVPIVGGSLVVGAIGGNLAEAGARKLGASDRVAEGSGAVGAMLTGAGVGALIGSPTGIGAPVGAVIGGVVGLGGYYLSKWL